ncbi:putative nucleic-acid-binding protein [Beggiatoa alba B18LD]|uniref:Putative nucleic-acid-binding protein n=1 Tax=Beggiatoa alba B18LD TaxID=395493 RepID=I3CE45_9GAMM|nr:PIN domain-containing protein [Beggiatoa alba]EIJ41888.1 putative nucleic-acid-binding protein [Beggiatoa alba B18LD]
MSDKVFFDTNLLIYLYSVDEPEKQQLVIEQIQTTENRWISTQVLNELSNTLYKKFKLECDDISHVLTELVDTFQVAVVQPTTIMQALEMVKRYHYSYYDSLIIATALEKSCNALYSEDMQHQQVIEQTLIILNPFKLRF